MPALFWLCPLCPFITLHTWQVVYSVKIHRFKFIRVAIADQQIMCNHNVPVYSMNIFVIPKLFPPCSIAILQAIKDWRWEGLRMRLAFYITEGGANHRLLFGLIKLITTWITQNSTVCCTCMLATAVARTRLRSSTALPLWSFFGGKYDLREFLFVVVFFEGWCCGHGLHCF